MEPPKDGKPPGGRWSFTHLWMRPENYHYDPFLLPDEKKDYIVKKRLELAGQDGATQSGFKAS